MTGEVLVPVIVFTALILALTVVVYLARAGLEPSGTVQLELGAERSIDVRAGERVLFALAEHGIYLPAACGGRGSCGECRVTVTRGARPLLATEEAYIEPGEAQAGVRLACQLKVLAPLSIQLAEESLSARRVIARVESNLGLSPWLKELVLSPESPLEFAAGDYVLVEAPPYRVGFSEFAIDKEYRERWEESGFFRLKSRSREATTRAYSLASSPAAPERLALVVRIALPPPTAPAGTPPGIVSSYLFSLKPGDAVSLLGPYGDFHIQDSDREIVLIGGGAGIAPLRSMVLDQIEAHMPRRMSLWYGARDAGDVCYEQEFRSIEAERSNFSYHVALSNAGEASEWQGSTGFIHRVVHDEYLATHPAPEAIEYYLCGPPLMSAAALQMLEGIGVPAERVFFDDFGA